MNLESVKRVAAGASKAIAGGLVTGVASVGTALVIVPENVVTPWWGYWLIGVTNAAIAFAGVYFAPANRK